MEYLASTWWIWLIVAAACNVFAMIVGFGAVLGFRMKLMGVAMLVHVVSVIFWILFIIGGIAALIEHAKT